MFDFSGFFFFFFLGPLPREFLSPARASQSIARSWDTGRQMLFCGTYKYLFLEAFGLRIWDDGCSVLLLGARKQQQLAQRRGGSQRPRLSSDDDNNSEWRSITSINNPNLNHWIFLKYPRVDKPAEQPKVVDEWLVRMRRTGTLWLWRPYNIHLQNK